MSACWPSGEMHGFRVKTNSCSRAVLHNATVAVFGAPGAPPGQ